MLLCSCTEILSQRMLQANRCPGIALNNEKENVWILVFPTLSISIKIKHVRHCRLTEYDECVSWVALVLVGSCFYSKHFRHVQQVYVIGSLWALSTFSPRETGKKGKWEWNNGEGLWRSTFFIRCDLQIEHRVKPNSLRTTVKVLLFFCFLYSILFADIFPKLYLMYHIPPTS